VPQRRDGLVHPCEFGAAPQQARAAIALIGDSHAEHWRGAIEVVAQALRWRGFSITRASCPFNLALAVLTSSQLTAQCKRWNAETLRWLARHREIRTVITSNHSGASFASDGAGGYRALWRKLPASVRRVYVLRDTPRIVRPQAGCVRRLVRAHAHVGLRCAQPRSLDLPADPAAAAARSGADSRVRLIDLSSLMCSPSVCPAVVGGVLVRKDGAHLTRLFAATLGPFVLRAIRRLASAAGSASIAGLRVSASAGRIALGGWRSHVPRVRGHVSPKSTPGPPPGSRGAGLVRASESAA
jgi:hypothetical protein